MSLLVPIPYASFDARKNEMFELNGAWLCSGICIMRPHQTVGAQTDAFGFSGTIETEISMPPNAPHAMNWKYDICATPANDGQVARFSLYSGVPSNYTDPVSICPTFTTISHTVRLSGVEPVFIYISDGGDQYDRTADLTLNMANLALSVLDSDTSLGPDENTITNSAAISSTSQGTVNSSASSILPSTTLIPSSSTSVSASTSLQSSLTSLSVLNGLTTIILIPTATNISGASETTSKSSLAPAIGGAIGGAFAILIVVGAVIFLIIRRDKAKARARALAPDFDDFQEDKKEDQSWRPPLTSTKPAARASLFPSSPNPTVHAVWETD